MASDLIQSLQQKFQQPNTPEPLPNQTEQTSALLGAKSGKAGASAPSATPRLSNIQEQVQNQQTQQALQKDQQQMQAQGQQAQLSSEEQENQISNRFAQLDESTAKQLDTYLSQSQSLLDQYNQGLRTFDFSKDKSRLESIGIAARISNDKYVNQLQQSAARSRLDDELSFNEALAQNIFAQEKDLFESNLDFRAMLGADNRQFNDEMANMNLDFALELAKSDNEAASKRAMWEGVGTLVGIGAKMYAANSGGETAEGSGSSQNTKVNVTSGYQGVTRSDPTTYLGDIEPIAGEKSDYA